MAAVSLSFRTPTEQANRLDDLVKATERSRTWHLEQALARYLDDQAWQVEQIKRGLADVEAGRVVPHAAVKAWIDSWGTDHELPMPE